MSRACAVILVLLVLATVAPAVAQPDDAQLQTLLVEANSFFDQGNAISATDMDGAMALYQKAILRFERIIRSGGVRNGKLYYNLGNAYFLSGDMGRAILNYRCATRYAANDPNLQQNLSHVRKQRRDRIEEPQRRRVLKTLFFWHYDLAARTRAVLFAVAFLSLWVLASLRLFRRSTAPAWAIVLCALLSAMLFGSVAFESYAHSRDQSGVILSSEVVAHKGNGETYQPSFEEPLHAGTEFTLIEERSGWRHIELHDGRRCWVPRDAAALVREDNLETSDHVAPASTPSIVPEEPEKQPEQEMLEPLSIEVGDDT